MAVSFGTIATASETAAGGGDTITVTKPTSLAAGDLMVLIVAVRTGSGNVPTCTGFSSVLSSGDNNRSLHILAKVADSSDAAASNFTVSYNASSGAPIVVAMVRCTTTSMFGGVGNFIFTSDDNTVAATTHTFTPGITPSSTGDLFIMGAYGTQISVTQSGYAIANNNPTWTERADVTQTATGDDANLSVATATPSAASATGDFNVTLSGSSEAIGYLVAIFESVDVTVSPSVVTATASVLAPAVTGGATVTPTVVTAQANVIAPTVTTAAPDWTNTDKTAAPSWVNPDKS